MANSIIDMHERAIVENKIVQQVLGVLDDLGRAALRSDRSVLLISNGRFEYGSHKTEATNLFRGQMRCRTQTLLAFAFLRLEGEASWA